MLSAVGRLPSYWGGDGLLSPAINRHQVRSDLLVDDNPGSRFAADNALNVNNEGSPAVETKKTDRVGVTVTSTASQLQTASAPSFDIGLSEKSMLSAVGRLPSYWGGDGLLSPAINLSTATHYPYLRLERLAEGAHQLHRSICFSVLAVYLFVAVRDPIRTFSFTRIAMSGPDGLASMTTSAGNGA